MCSEAGQDERSNQDVQRGKDSYHQVYIPHEMFPLTVVPYDLKLIGSFRLLELRTFKLESSLSH